MSYYNSGKNVNSHLLCKYARAMLMRIELASF